MHFSLPKMRIFGVSAYLAPYSNTAVFFYLGGGALNFKNKLRVFIS